jgi:membrane protease YdiL (CAAX protease family)
VYGAAYAIAGLLGWVSWSPGGGLWNSGTRIALNLVVNLSILSTIGTATALGEELGWRGYLQPRLDAAGVPSSFVIVGVCWTLYHAPFTLIGSGAEPHALTFDLARGLVLDLTLAFIWAHLAYAAGSLWPAVLLHSFHNAVAQWLFPRFFAGAEEPWLGEGGILPIAGYLIAALGIAVFRSRRTSLP